MLIDVVEVSPLPAYRLSLVFSDGMRGIFDMTPYLDTGQYRRLRDPHVFSLVHVDCFTASWPGGIDIAPERLYMECTPL